MRIGPAQLQGERDQVGLICRGQAVSGQAMGPDGNAAPVPAGDHPAPPGAALGVHQLSRHPRPDLMAENTIKKGRTMHGGKVLTEATPTPGKAYPRSLGITP